MVVFVFTARHYSSTSQRFTEGLMSVTPPAGR
jgi:hypothetical protein